MAGTLVNTITKHKYSLGPSSEGGDRLKIMTGLITLKEIVADLTDGVTTKDSPIVTSVTALTGFAVGDYVTVSAGFPSTTAEYKIIAKTATTLTLDTDATSSETAVTISQVVQTLNLSDDFPTLEGIVMNPNGGYVFDYDYATKKFIVYAQATTPAPGEPLEALAATGLTALVIHYMAWGY